jgi:hypothetical protein
MLNDGNQLHKTVPVLLRQKSYGSYGSGSGSGSESQKSTGFQVLDPNSQHCLQQMEEGKEEGKEVADPDRTLSPKY